MGFFPIHAVAANGNRSMYDYLTNGLPEELRAYKTPLTQLGRLVTENMENMTPLQLTAKLGLRFMLQVTSPTCMPACQCPYTSMFPCESCILSQLPTATPTNTKTNSVRSTL